MAAVWQMTLLSTGLFLQLSAVSGTNCQDQLTCHECLQTANCAWCSRPVDNNIDEQKRCFPASSVIPNCDGHIVNYENEGEIQEAKDLTRKSSPNQEIVQISPQKVSVKLRVNTPYQIPVNYTQAEDNPLDLYYLMDVSWSMRDDIKNLRTLGNILAAEMVNITSNFRMGFGSFVDKTMLPFLTPKSNLGKKMGQRMAYGFRNDLKLTYNTSLFTKTLMGVDYADAFAQNDPTEGGLDAMMQAVVCQEAIGWRNDTRRLLLYSSDAKFHYAGDGKLAGLIIPNDGLCHLDQNGEYDYFNRQDFPSISQINHKVKENSINVIFAVTEDLIDLYKQLSVEVEGSMAAKISTDSSNIVSLVKEEYNKIRTSVEMKAEPSEPVKVTFYSNCVGEGPQIQTAKCEELALGSVVSFTAELELMACPSDRSQWNQTIRIKPVGVSQEVTVDVEMLCDCPCERPKHEDYEIDSSKCSGEGSYQCGVCECAEGHVGRTCECGSDSPVGINSTNSCRQSKDQEVCSGRGDCRCGKCNCKMEQGFQTYGNYCQCDDFTCERHNKQICSGPEQGRCKCGVCNCLPGWGGSACACSLSTDSCLPKGGGKLCSGRGRCDCNKCQCDIIKDNQRYLGNVCQICPTCPDHCDQLTYCVDCLSYQTGEQRKICETNCTDHFNLVLPDQEVVQAEEEILCYPEDKNGCYFKFTYSYNAVGEVTTRAQKKKECHEPINLFVTGLGVTGSILIIGLVSLIIWKVSTTILDRREFAKFQKEILEAKWTKDKNPLYTPAVREFANPTYGI